MSDREATPPENRENELDSAIEELKGVLNDEAGAEVSTAGMEDDNHRLIMTIPVEVQIVLGSAEMPVSQLMSLKKGSTVSLNRRIGEPVDVVVNGRRIARGEITLVDDDPSRFGIRLTDIADVAGA